MIFLVLGVAIISIGVLIVAISLRSRPLATMGFIMNFAVGLMIEPWKAFLAPLPSDDEQLTWLTAVVWSATIGVTIIGWVVVYILSMPKKSSNNRGRRRRRRRRSSSSSSSRSDDSSIPDQDIS